MGGEQELKELTSSFSINDSAIVKQERLTSDFLESHRVSGEDSATVHQLDSEISTDSPIFRLSAGISTLPEELRPANAVDGNLDNIVKIINGGVSGTESWMPMKRHPFGTLVPPGCIHIAECSGRIYATGPGRWMLSQSRKFSGYARWVGAPINVTNNTQPIRQGALTICRIAQNQVGLAFENSVTPVLLGPGLHVYNTPSFRFDRIASVQDDHVQHGTFCMLQITRGKYALVWETPTQPRILQQGSYVVKSPTFKFEKFVNMEETYIKHGTIHIIQVPKGNIAKVTESVTPKLLNEGVHVVDHANFHFHGLELLSSPLVKHGTITRFRVTQGEIGMATWQNEATFVERPGTYEVDSPDFIFHKVAAVSDKLLQNGNKKMVTVFSGEVGLSYKAGTLDVLHPGRHIISASDHYFDSFLSTQQVALRLIDPTDGDDFFVAETKDFVKVGICADVFYSITDASKTVVKVGKEGVKELVMETAVGVLTNIIRSTALNEIAQSQAKDCSSIKAAEDSAADASKNGRPSAPMFFDRAHDEFISRLNDDFVDRFGIEIANIRFASCKIMDKELSASISKQAIVTAQTENQVANLKGQTEIATAEQTREARVAQIAAEQEARALKVQTESQNKAKLEKAEAEAKSKAVYVAQQNEALITKARAEAEAIKLKAEAEAEGIRIRARAEAERAELLGNTPLGAQLALLQLWAGTVEKSNEGIEKVVYCDPSVQLAAGGGNPLGLLGLGSMNSDLTKLTSLGVDSGAYPVKK